MAKALTGSRSLIIIDIRYWPFLLPYLLHFVSGINRSVETAEVTESTIGTGAGRLLLHVVMLVDDAGLVLTNLGLLSLLEHRVEVFIQIILRLIQVGRGRRHLSRWHLEAILGDAEGEFGLRGHVRLSQRLARHLGELVGAWAGKLG